MIRSTARIDHERIAAVVAAAFGRADEADLVGRLRADGDALVELVAEEADGIVGHVMFSRLGAGSGQAFAALAPVSVIPDRQGAGIGSALIEAGLAACRGLDLDAAVVLGHPAYYPRFGFSAAAAKALSAPFSGPAFMAFPLKPGALDKPTAIRYAAAFGIA